MKWPLYEEVENLLWIIESDSIFNFTKPYLMTMVYCLLWMNFFGYCVFRPIKYLSKQNPQESFWDKYDTGGI